MGKGIAVKVKGLPSDKATKITISPLKKRKQLVDTLASQRI